MRFEFRKPNRTSLVSREKVNWQENCRNIISWLSCTVKPRRKHLKPWKRKTRDDPTTTTTVTEKVHEIDRRSQPPTAIVSVNSNDKNHSSDIPVSTLDESQRTELTEALHEQLGSSSTQPTEVVCDVLLWHKDGTTQLQRRLFLDPKTLVNVMAEEVRQDLGEELGAYNGPPVCVNGQADVKPLGKVKAKYELVKGNRVYEDLFLVIESDAFDVLLGQKSIMDHMLYRALPPLARLLRENV